MSAVGAPGAMPPARDFGWRMRAATASRFDTIQRPDLRFARAMDAAPPDALTAVYDEGLFLRRVEILRGARDPYAAQAYDQPSFL